MTGTLVTFAAGLAVLLSAAVLHELTHILTIRLLPGVRVGRVHLVLGSDVHVAESCPKRVQEATGIAPTIVGVAVGVAFVLLQSWPAPSVWTLIGIAAWAVYTAPSKEDLLVALPEDARAGHEDTVSVVRYSFLALVGWAVSVVGYGTPLQLMGEALALAGLVLLGSVLIRDASGETARAGAS